MGFGSLGAAGGGGAVASSGWQRPADWLAMPATVENAVDILAAVFNDESNYVAVEATVTGGFQVDWGDGNVTTHNSDATAEHQYDYADTDLGALTERGYKQALIRITPQAANDITAFDLSVRHTRSNLNATSSPWLDIQVNTPSATSITIKGALSTNPCTFCERVNFVAMGAVTSLVFNFMRSLQSVTFPAGSLQSLSTMSGMFQNCNALREVEFPAGSLQAVTNMLSCFSGCTALETMEFPASSLASVTTIQSAFEGCSTLRKVTWPAGSLVICTSLTLLFSSTYLLEEAVFPDGGFPDVTSIGSAFTNCGARRIIFPGDGVFSSLVTTSSAFSNCTRLSILENFQCPVSFSITGCNFDGQALDSIYDALPAASATITVGTNHGTADDDTSIATGKGWTVT